MTFSKRDTAELCRGAARPAAGRRRGDSADSQVRTQPVESLGVGWFWSWWCFHTRWPQVTKWSRIRAWVRRGACPHPHGDPARSPGAAGISAHGWRHTNHPLGNGVAVFTVTGLFEIHAALRTRVSYAMLLAGLSLLIAWLFAWEKILDHPSANTYRWLLIAAAVLLLAASVRLALRARDRRGRSSHRGCHSRDRGGNDRRGRGRLRRSVRGHRDAYRDPIQLRSGADR